ncbi:slipin family protein, partial [Streptomyces sp. NPDC054838]
AEKNSTLVLPFPVELLRFLERAAPTPSDATAPPPAAPAPRPHEPAAEGAQPPEAAEAAAGPGFDRVNGSRDPDPDPVLPPGHPVPPPSAPDEPDT